MDWIETLFIFFLSLGLLLAGYYSNDLIRSWNYDREYNGLMFTANNSHPQALQTARAYDKYGDWVCSNVRGMSFGDAEDTCNHECMHYAYSEIIAEDCEKDVSKCALLLDNWSAGK